jgi:hypothetical protein
LRLKYLGDIETLGIVSRSAVSNFTSSFKKSGLEINQALAMEEQQLLACLFPELKQYRLQTDKSHPDWNYVHADSLIESTKNIANHGLDKGGEVAQESIKNIANSQLGWMIGLALLLFVFFKYGIEALVAVWKKWKA